MLAVSGGEADLEGAGGNPGVSSQVKVAVCFSGLFDFIRGEGGEKEGGSIAKRAFNRLWIGGPLDENRELWAKASPINFITPDDAPILFVHSRKDSMVPWSQSEQMYEALKTSRPESKLLLLDEGGHNIRDNRKVKGEAWAAAIAYFKEHL
jgi:dipeptidyl aminopeptidase/acylaminoacyl peptidase